MQLQSVRADARIRTWPFQKDNVVYLAGMMGVSTMIVFNEDEIRSRRLRWAIQPGPAGGPGSIKAASVHQAAAA
ncbi:hypothetical protein ACOJBO_08160 [Rhizobium beringeri]